MNKYITAIKALDFDRIAALIRDESKWIGWSEPDGKNALHYLCGPCAKDAGKPDERLAILKLLLKSCMDINSIHRIEEKNCDFFPATPLWYAYTRGRNEKDLQVPLKKGADPVIVGGRSPGVTKYRRPSCGSSTERRSTRNRA